MYDIFC